MDSDVEVFTSNIVEGFNMLLRRMSAFVSCQVEAYDSSVRESHSQFSNFQRQCRVLISHGTKNQTELSPCFLPSGFKTFKNRSDHFFKIHASFCMKFRSKSYFCIDYMFFGQIQYLFFCYAIKSLFVLHDRECNAEGLQVQR